MYGLREHLYADQTGALVHDLVIQTVENYAMIASHGDSNDVLDIRDLRRKQ